MRKLLLCLFVASTLCAFGQSKVKRPDTYNYNRGMEEMSQDEYEEALKYFNQEIEDNPKNGHAYAWIATIYYLQDKYGKALSASDMALKNLPKKDEEYVSNTYDVRAKVYLELKDTLKAIEDYSTAIKLFPKQTDFYPKRAQIYFEQEKYDLAEADYMQLIKMDQASYEGHMGLGRNLNAQKRWDEAIEQFNRVADMYSDNSLIYSFRAAAYLEKEKWSEATDDLIHALNIDHDDYAFNLMLDLKEPAFGIMKAKLKIQGAKQPNEAYWPYCIAAMHEDKDEYDKAVTFYEEANSKDDDDVLRRRLAVCYKEIGDYNNALRCLEQAIELDSTDIQNNMVKAELLYEMGDVKNAIAEWDKIIEEIPDLDLGYASRGWLKSMSGDYEDAIEDYTMSITIAPEESYTYACRGDTYTRMGKTELAKADYQKVVELEDSPEKYAHNFYAYQGLGENEKAIAALDTIIAHDPNNNGVYYNAACMYARMKNKDKALEYLNKCLEMGYCSFNHMNRDYDLDFLREEPEFKAMVEKYESAAKAKFATADADDDSTGKEVTTEVPFTKEGGVYNVKCKINELPLYFIFDTGAADVSISTVEATFMLKNGFLDKKDMAGSKYYTDASGNISEGTIINLKKVDFGGLQLENVKAAVIKNQKAPLLLGQSVLSRLGKIEIDYDKHVLKITHKEK